MTSLVSWVGVLLQRLYEVFAGENPSEHYALVLMDEIDAHMHPSWQQILVSRLKEMFPNVQFIATTHSPMIVAGRSREEILVFARDEDSKQIVVTRPKMDFRGLRADQILTSSAFGLAGARDIETVVRQQRYGELLNNLELTPEEQQELESLRRDPAVTSSPVEETLRREALTREASEQASQRLEQKPAAERRRLLEEAEEQIDRVLNDLRS